MKAGSNLKWFKEGEEVPDDARFIKFENRIVGYQEEDPQDYHYLQSPNYYPIEEKFYLYELKV